MLQACLQVTEGYRSSVKLEPLTSKHHPLFCIIPGPLSSYHCPALTSRNLKDDSDDGVSQVQSGVNATYCPLSERTMLAAVSASCPVLESPNLYEMVYFLDSPGPIIDFAVLATDHMRSAGHELVNKVLNVRRRILAHQNCHQNI
jgi:hypothetical protein